MEKSPEYAIVDIETTGGAVGNSCMTEIAIRIFNGQKVIDQYDTLINPGQHIPSYITALTGINQEMVAESPFFKDIAQKVFDLLNGRIFVAHNVNFDYSFIKQQLADAGIHWSAKRLCTVRLSRKIQPGLPSYSLGRLCKYFSIDHQQRHRAAGDVDATVSLFRLLGQQDMHGHLQKMLHTLSGEQKLPAHLDRKDFEALPEQTGVYYFLNKQGKVIYVGKAKNLKKRVGSHFTGHNVSARRQDFIREIYHISFEVCGSELMALLLECQEIKRLWPAYNSALKETDFKYGLFLYEDQSGYFRLGVGKRLKYIPCIQSFNRLSEAVNTLRQLRDTYALDPARCVFNGGIMPGKAQTERKRPSEEPVSSYNQRVQTAVDSLNSRLSSYLVIDQGRKGGEQSCVWVDRGQVRAMGYVAETSDLKHYQQIQESLTPCNSNPYMLMQVQAYIQKHPGRVFKLS